MILRASWPPPTAVGDGGCSAVGVSERGLPSLPLPSLLLPSSAGRSAVGLEGAKRIRSSWEEIAAMMALIPWDGGGWDAPTRSLESACGWVRAGV